MNTRHVKGAAVDGPEDDATVQADEGVRPSTEVGRRPGVVQRPASKHCACVIQA